MLREIEEWPNVMRIPSLMFPPVNLLAGSYVYWYELLPNTLLRTSLNVRHLSRMWSTVCRPSPQSHPGPLTSGTLLFYGKSLSPIFSVRIWMSRALCHFFRPWCNRRILCDGCGVCLNVVLPLVSAFQLFIHSALVCLFIHVFKVA
jgi:hypothetical protein